MADAEGVDPERTFATFRDYWRAKGGASARKLDWDATWRNWCRKEADSKPARRSSKGYDPTASLTWRPTE